MRTDRDAVLQLLGSHREEMKGLGIKSLALFGSFARNEAGPDSDVDLLVEFDRPVGLFHFVRVHRYLETLLGRKVDLVTPDALKERLRDRILRELVSAA